MQLSLESLKKYDGFSFSLLNLVLEVSISWISSKILFSFWLFVIGLLKGRLLKTSLLRMSSIWN